MRFNIAVFDTVITLDANNKTTLKNLAIANLNSDDLLFAS